MTSTNKAIHITARAVIITNDHILCAYNPKEKDRTYYLPGGHLEHHEKMEDTIKREMREELGTEGSLKRLLGVIETTFDANPLICHNHSVSFYFEVDVPQLTPSPQEFLAKDGSDTLVWIPLNKLTDYPLRPKMLARILPEWLKGPSCTITSSIEHTQK